MLQTGSTRWLATYTGAAPYFTSVNLAINSIPWWQRSLFPGTFPWRFSDSCQIR